MKIRSAAVIGMGAVGGFFAPAFAQQLGEEGFCVIADGERKKRLERGLKINGEVYYFPIVTPQEAYPVDLIVMSVKEAGFAQAVEDIRGFVGDDTQILCVMNGVGHEEILCDVFGEEHVLYSYMKITSEKKGDSIVYDPDCSLRFGEKENKVLSERVEAVKELLDACGLPYVIEENMELGIWVKFMLNVGTNLTCAIFGLPYGACNKSEHALRIQSALMEEVMAVAQAKGIPLTKELAQEQIALSKTLPPASKPSTLQDLEHKRKTEIEMFAGAVVKMGRKLGVETPCNWMIQEIIQTLEEKNQGILSL